MIRTTQLTTIVSKVWEARKALCMLLALYGIVAGAGFLSEAARMAMLERSDGSADERLHRAIHLHDTQAIQCALDEGADIDRANPAQCTPLMLAVRGADLASVRVLIARGANVNAQTDLGTALSDAALNGFDDLVSLLLASGADPNLGTSVRTRPLWRAACSGTPARACVGLLLEHGADPNIRDEDGVTPLMLAIRDGDAEIVAMLLESGADRTLVARDGSTAITLATATSNQRIAVLLDPE